MALTGQYIYSFYNSNSAQVVINCSNPAILSAQRGCTVLPTASHSFYFSCTVINNQIVIKNNYINTNYNFGGQLQLVVGITNPNAPLTFNLTGY